MSRRCEEQDAAARALTRRNASLEAELRASREYIGAQRRDIATALSLVKPSFSFSTSDDDDDDDHHHHNNKTTPRASPVAPAPAPAVAVAAVTKSVNWR